MGAMMDGLRGQVRRQLLRHPPEIETEPPATQTLTISLAHRYAGQRWGTLQGTTNMTSTRIASHFFKPLCALLMAFGVAHSPAALASGSVGAGSGGVSQYGTLYTQGKSAFFRKLACDRTDCAYRRSAVNAELAQSLVAALATRAGVKFETSESDAAVSRLCPGEAAVGCTGAVDEQEAVQYYLSRRFGIGQ